MSIAKPVVPLIVLVALTAFGWAQLASSVTVQRASHADYLTDAEGRSLYIYLRDAPNESSCYDQCAVNWPPLLVGGEPIAGPGVVASLLGTTQRSDGSVQLTFNGWPLYHHARDLSFGQTFGHGLGDIFYLINSGGVRVRAEPPAPPADDDGEEAAPAQPAAPAATPNELATEEGARLYASNCAVCHGPAGEGLIGPALAGHPGLVDTTFIVSTILAGRPTHGMPPFADVLDDADLAELATFVRNAWTNAFGAVSADEVAALRE